MLSEPHVDGPGLKVLNPRKKWYGPGYCGICGCRSESLVPRAVRWWDPDDGWKMGVLCVGCGIEASARGPRAGDFAMGADPGEAIERKARIDVSAELGDLDGTWSETGQGD
jgi:hypothetical protein